MRSLFILAVLLAGCIIGVWMTVPQWWPTSLSTNDRFALLLSAGVLAALPAVWKEWKAKR